MANVCGIVAIIGGLITLILQIISLATAVWIVADFGESSASIGLWQTCAPKPVGCTTLKQGNRK